AGIGGLTVTCGGPTVARAGHATFTGSGHTRLGRGRLPEVVTDQLALLGQELVEVLVHVLLANRFRGQVQILELLELARPGLLRCLPTVVPGPIRRPLLRLGGRLLAGRPLRRPLARRRLPAAGGPHQSSYRRAAAARTVCGPVHAAERHPRPAGHTS